MVDIEESADSGRRKTLIAQLFKKIDFLGHVAMLRIFRTFPREVLVFLTLANREPKKNDRLVVWR